MSETTTPKITIKKPMSFIKGVSITFATRVYAFITGTIAGIIFARVLGPEALGIASVTAIVVTITLQLGYLGIQTAVIYYGSDNKIPQKDLVGNTLFLGVSIGTILTAIITIIALTKPEVLIDDINPLFLYLVIPQIPFTLIIEFLRSNFMSQQKFGLYNLVDIAGYTINLIGTTLILLVFKLGLISMMIFSIFLNIPLALFGIIYFHKTHGISLKVNFQIIKKLISYGFKFFICNLCGYIVIKSDIYLINNLLKTNDAGIYQTVSAYADTIFGVSSIIAAILLPKLTADQNHDSRRENSLKTLRVTSTALFILLMLFAIFARLAIWIMYGPTYLDAHTPLLLILPGIFFLSLEVIQVMYLISGYLPNIIPITWIFAALLNIATNLILIPMIGISGAAISSTFTYGLVFIVVTYLYKKKTKATFKKMFIIQKEEIELIREKFNYFFRNIKPKKFNPKDQKLV